MKILIVCGVILMMYLSVCIRLTIFHPIKFIKNITIDAVNYIRFKKWRQCLFGGKLICYAGLFGKGKTLSAVHKVTTMYNRYNGKFVYDPERKKWVRLHIKVLSNVDLIGIPYEKFVSLSQLVKIANTIKDIDTANDTSTVTIALGDEFSVQLNSRSFKSNIDAHFLNTLLTCRHHGGGPCGGISLIYTAQRFQHVDKLLRDVTTSVIQCDKVWRFQTLKEYDAFEIENASNTSMVKPLRRFGWFVQNSDYNAYDTKACVANLAKSCADGDMLTDKEILDLQCPGIVDNDAVTRPSRKLKKMRKSS